MPAVFFLIISGKIIIYFKFVREFNRKHSVFTNIEHSLKCRILWVQWQLYNLSISLFLPILDSGSAALFIVGIEAWEMPLPDPPEQEEWGRGMQCGSFPGKLWSFTISVVLNWNKGCKRGFVSLDATLEYQVMLVLVFWLLQGLWSQPSWPGFILNSHHKFCTGWYMCL